MKLFIVGAESPISRELINLLQQHEIKFQALASEQFILKDKPAMSALVADSQATQIINLMAFHAGSQRALYEAEVDVDQCFKINALVPAALAAISEELQLPLLQLSNSYVFGGDKSLGYNEEDDVGPVGVYGKATLQGEEEVLETSKALILRTGWLFGMGERDMIEEWLHQFKDKQGSIQIGKNRFSPTPIEDVARVILALCQQLDCDINVWGIYHYCGLETKKVNEFVEQAIKYAAQYDEDIYQLIKNLKINETETALPEISNSTLSSKKILDTFGIKQKTWHGSLQKVVKAIYDSH